MGTKPAFKIPTRVDAVWFWLRVWGLVLLRGLRNLRTAGLRRHSRSPRLARAPVVAESRTPLWDDGRTDEFVLLAGKVHNLRLAAKAFDQVHVPAHGLLSFWRQLGRTTRWRGYAVGREIREGCAVPTVAGGLCQLSNALANCAVQAGMTLVERHTHSARIEDAARDRPGLGDATVFWNYLDLRLSAKFAFQLNVALTATELVVRIRAETAAVVPDRIPRVISLRRSQTDRTPKPVARGCLTCNETACFRHRPDAAFRTGRTAILLNAWTTEFARYLEPYARDADWFIPWVRVARRGAGSWHAMPLSSVHIARTVSMRRMAWLRWHAVRNEGGRRQAAVMQADHWLAQAYARALRPEHTQLVIDQSLLVPLQQLGALGGRRYDVLLQTLPAAEIQQRLDLARERWPQADSLADFRIDETYCHEEIRALQAAQRVITPHVEVARHARSLVGLRDVRQLAWASLPAAPRLMRDNPAEVPTVVFPASALARKGVLDLVQALRILGWELTVLGSPAEDPRIWDGVFVTCSNYHDPRWLQKADVVALPAYIEHSPRALLRARDAGIPIVATPACGLPASEGLQLVPPGDVAALVAALQRAVPRNEKSK